MRLILAAAIFAAVTATATAEDWPAQMARARCILADRLAQLQANPSPKDRFLVLQRRDNHNYVQCLFLADHKQLLCEALSGFYMPGRPDVIGDKGRAVLARAGFSTDFSQGNYQRMIALDAQTSMDEVAGSLLTVMHDAYGAQDSMAIDTLSALLPPHDGAMERCRPTG